MKTYHAYLSYRPPGSTTYANGYKYYSHSKLRINESSQKKARAFAQAWLATEGREEGLLLHLTRVKSGGREVTPYDGSKVDREIAKERNTPREGTGFWTRHVGPAASTSRPALLARKNPITPEVMERAGVEKDHD